MLIMKVLFIITCGPTSSYLIAGFTLASAMLTLYATVNSLIYRYWRFKQIISSISVHLILGFDTPFKSPSTAAWGFSNYGPFTLLFTSVK